MDGLGRESSIDCLAQVVAVVRKEHHLDARIAQLGRVPRGGGTYRAVIAIVGRLAWLSLCERIPMELIREDMEATRVIVDEGTEAFVNGHLIVAYLIEHRLHHHHVAQDRTLEQIDLVQHDIGVEHQVGVPTQPRL
eukprot:scaffold114103_cov29-Tisochrysis_lutea.AAC.1